MHRWHPLCRAPFCAVLFVLLLPRVRADEAPTYINAHKPLTSTAMILVPLDDKGGSQGSGFVLDRKARLLVTNSHVVQDKEQVVAVFPVDQDSEIMIITQQAKLIRLEAGAIRKTGRSAQGVRLIKTDEGDKVTSASLVEAASDEETEE